MAFQESSGSVPYSWKAFPPSASRAESRGVTSHPLCSQGLRVQKVKHFHHCTRPWHHGCEPLGFHRIYRNNENFRQARPKAPHKSPLPLEIQKEEPRQAHTLRAALLQPSITKHRWETGLPPSADYGKAQMSLLGGLVSKKAGSQDCSLHWVIEPTLWCQRKVCGET